MTPQTTLLTSGPASQAPASLDVPSLKTQGCFPHNSIRSGAAASASLDKAAPILHER